MQHAPIALIGYRGTGKTTISRLLGMRLGYDWVDADVEIELRLGKSIAAIFADEGEEAFRDAESAVVEELCQREKTILALGGGAILRESNRVALEKCRAVVWLKASVGTIAQRMAEDPTTAERRPNLTNRGGRTEISQLLAQREPIYRACATLEVDTEQKAPTVVVDEILAALAEAS